MELSQGEKLILLALAAAKDKKEEIDLDFIRSAILSGNTWALSWELSGIPSEDIDPSIAHETADILSMWSFIEHSVKQLSPAERKSLDNAVYPAQISFSGFDGNNDAHYGVASFLINEMGRFDEFKGRPLNSHTPSSLPNYRRMLNSYNNALRGLSMGTALLTADQIAHIVRGDE